MSGGEPTAPLQFKRVLESARGVPSRDALLATQSAVHSVIMGDLSIEHVLPLCLHHLKSAHIPSGTPSRSSDRTLHETYAVSCLQLVLTHGPPNGPADPADDRPLSLQHGVRERQLMIAAASDVWAWLAYYAARLLAFPDLGAVDWAAGALKTVCGGLLLFEDAAFRGQPEAAYVVLVLWVGSERGEPAARDIIRKAMFDPLVDGHRVMLLVLQAAEQHPERSEDLAFAAAVALARLKRQPRDNPEQLERLMTLLAVINKLCRVPEFRAHETLLSPNSIKEIMRVLDLLLPPKGVTEHANATLSRLVSTGIQLCTGFLQFAFLQRNCRATWIAEAVDGGLLVTLHRAEPWMSAHARETDKYTLRPAKGRLGRLLEEGVLTHMWNVHVCGAVDSALRKMLRDYAFRLEDIDPRLVRLHSRWNGYNVDAITSSAFSMEPHCHYSKCPNSSENQKPRNCLGCWEVSYCGADCQTKAWKATGDNHRVVCQSTGARNEDDLSLTSAEEITFAESVAVHEVNAASSKIREALARAHRTGILTEDQILEVEFSASGPSARLARLESRDATERKKY